MKKKTTALVGCGIVVAGILAFGIWKSFYKPVPENNVNGVVELAFGDIDAVCENAELAEAGGELLSEMEKSDNLLMSLAVDTTIELTPDELGQYDHLVIANPEWMAAFADKEKLSPVDMDDVTEGMRTFLNVQMELWTNDGSAWLGNAALYEYSGGHMLAFPANVGELAPAIYAENPLIVLIDNPVETMSMSGFLLPMASSGNIVFNSEEKLAGLLADNAINSYVNTIRQFKLK